MCENYCGASRNSPFSSSWQATAEEVTRNGEPVSTLFKKEDSFNDDSNATTGEELENVSLLGVGFPQAFHEPSISSEHKWPSDESFSMTGN